MESQMFYGTGPSTVQLHDQSSESSSEDDSESDEFVCSGDENQYSESDESDDSDHELVADCEEEHSLPITIEKWNEVTATSRNFIFTSKEEFHLEFETENAHAAHPIDVFNKLVTPELIERIVIETNLFANQTIAETTMTRSSPITEVPGLKREKRKRCIGCYEMISANEDAKTARKKARKVTTFYDYCETKPFFCLHCFKLKHSN